MTGWKARSSGSLENQQQVTGLEGELQRLGTDRSRLAQSLDAAEARSGRMEEANREVSRRLVAAMESIRDVLAAQQRRLNRGKRTMGQVNVTISGKTYRMACDDGQEEHLDALGRQLGETIELLRTQFGEIGDQRLTVMAAITLADRYSEAERRVAQLEAEVTGLEEARAAIAERADSREFGVAEAMETLAERLESLAGRLNGADPLQGNA